MGSVEALDLSVLDQKLEDRYLRGILGYSKLLEVTVTILQPENFSTTHKSNIFLAIREYWKEFQQSPDSDMVAMMLREIANDDEATLATKVLQKILTLPLPEWGWIYSRIDQYVQHIKLQKSVYEASHHLKESQLERAQDALLQGLTKYSLLKESSNNDLDLSDEMIQGLSEDSAAFVFPSRIYALDDVIRGFYRKELAIILAPLNTGKSWALTHLAISALISSRKVLYFTLEMSRERVLQRMLQSVSASPRASSSSDRARKVEIWDEDWRGKEQVVRKTLADTHNVARHLRFLRRFRGVLSVIEYPSGDAQLSDLQRHIEIFDAAFGQYPDVILIDGVMDMQLHVGDGARVRMGISALVKGFRKFASDYNCSVIVTHQANRDSMKANVVGAEHVGESISVMQIADLALTLNQTKAEKQLEVMRIHLARARNDRKWLTFKVYQSLAIGGFCLASELDTSDDEDEQQATISQQSSRFSSPRSKQQYSDKA